MLGEGGGDDSLGHVAQTHLALRPKIFWHHPVVAQERGKWLEGLEMAEGK